VNSWKVILATLVIFGAGVVTGALLMANSGKGRSLLKTVGKNPEPAHSATNTPARHKLPPPLGGPLRKNFLDRLDTEIKLTPPQRERIERIISEGQENTRVLWELVEPDIHAELVGTRERIRRELTPEQQALFTECVKKRSTSSPTNTPPVEPATNASPANP
jgi:hypothetical protein